MNPSIGGSLRALAEDLDGRWRRLEREPGRFPELAHECLERAALAGQVGVDAVMAWVLASRADPRAEHPSPGVLPLYRGEHFDLHAHLWVDDVAVPHDHGWAGAFQILQGRSLTGYYQFHASEQVRSVMALGELSLSRLALHGPGDTIAVHPSARLIHGFHYVEPPGLAISVRSKLRDRESRTYLRPGLAVEARATDLEVEQQLRALELLASFDPERLESALGRLVLSADRAARFVILSHATQAGWPASPALLSAIAEAEPSSATLFGALDDLRAYQRVVELRSEHRQPELRGFLAALHLCSGREAFLDALDLLGLCGVDRAPWSRIGAWLVTLLIDDEEGGVEVPACVPMALGRLAAGDPLGRAIELANAAEHAELLAAAEASLRAGPLYRPLFGSPEPP